MDITWDSTARGFCVGEFRDFYEQDCSIQRSSIATEDCIWFGVDNGLEHGGPIKRNGSEYAPLNARMHLSREQVKALLPTLRHFAKTGRLPVEEADR